MDLRSAVEELVMEKINKGDAFTNADISHPIISKDKSVRHREVKEIIDTMEQDSLFSDENYTFSLINVFPGGPGTRAVSARLWHHVNDDPANYKNTTKVLIRGADPISPVSQISSVQPVNSISTNKSSASLIRKQVKYDVINIPKKLIQEAGFHAGEQLDVDSSKVPIIISRAKNGNGNKVVDRDGRIRLHGNKVTKVSSAGMTTAVVIKNAGEMQILVG